MDFSGYVAILCAYITCLYPQSSKIFNYNRENKHFIYFIYKILVTLTYLQNKTTTYIYLNKHTKPTDIISLTYLQKK